MMADSSVTIIGGLTRDPELRFTPGGQAVANFAVAVSRRYQQNNEWKEVTSYFDVKAWGQLGENVAASLTKGSRVIVTGRLEQESWEKNGEKRSKLVLVADACGPDLRWATATVDRNERRDGTARSAAPASGGDDDAPF